MNFIKVIDTAGEPVIIPKDEITMVVPVKLQEYAVKRALIYRKSFSSLQTVHQMDYIELLLRD